MGKHYFHTCPHETLRGRICCPHGNVFTISTYVRAYYFLIKKFIFFNAQNTKYIEKPYNSKQKLSAYFLLYIRPGTHNELLFCFMITCLGQIVLGLVYTMKRHL